MIDKMIESARGRVMISGPYDEDLVAYMRRVGLARYWDADDKLYDMPEEMFLDDVREHLHQLGYELV